jgi:predicted PurR-regulated permease PerM
MSVTEPRSDHAARPLRVVAAIAAPSARGLARVIVVLAVCVTALYLLYLTRGVGKLLAISVFTAIALGPLVDVVQRTGVTRGWAIAMVYVTLVLAVVGAGVTIVPASASQVQRLSHDGQHALADLRSSPPVRRYDERYHVTERIQQQLRALPQRASRLSGPLRDVTVGVFGFITDLVTVLSIAFLLLLNGRRYSAWVFDTLPAHQATRARRLAPLIYTAVSRYLLGNLVISAIAGAGAWLVMTVLGVPFALPLALLVAFLDLIPMIGATLAAAAVALVALLVSPVAALVWVAYALAYQQLENYVIQPLVYRRALDVSPLVTIVAVLVGGALLGLLGVLLAIPLAATLQLTLTELRRPVAAAPLSAAGVAWSGDPACDGRAAPVGALTTSPDHEAS